MRNYLLFYILFFFASAPLLAQDITFGIANKVTTSTDVTFDVTLSSDTDFKLGSGQLYFNFNTDAFGEWVVTNSRVTITRPSGCVLAQQYLGIIDIYSTFIINDNTASRLSFSWQQGWSSGGILANNITSTPAVLFQVTIEFDTGGSGEPDDICFESGNVYDDQTFTACGPATPTFANCSTDPGTQLTDDNFNCSALVPIELVDFRARANNDQTTLLEWQTANESNNDYFTIERSFDGRNFEVVDQVPGAGNSQQILDYKTIDPNPQMGVNYYRLKQTDLDGQFSFSDIQIVEFSSEKLTEVHVFPNPVTDLLNVRFNQNISQGQVQLFNSAGQLVKVHRVERNTNQTQFSLDQLAEGLYWIKVEADGQFYSQNIVVTK